jgi:hypothetical protein
MSLIGKVNIEYTAFCFSDSEEAVEQVVDEICEALIQENIMRNMGDLFKDILPD